MAPPLYQGQAWHYADTHLEVYAMRTNIVIDDELVAEVMRVTRVRSKREAVDLALRELLARRRQRELKALAGTDLIDPDYDVRAACRRIRAAAAARRP
ncbi:MAG: type II toxin-antitoxin system VapB family antitoxin [Pseudomonadota bacterium]